MDFEVCGVDGRPRWLSGVDAARFRTQQFECEKVGWSDEPFDQVHSAVMVEMEVCENSVDCAGSGEASSDCDSGESGAWSKNRSQARLTLVTY